MADLVSLGCRRPIAYEEVRVAILLLCLCSASIAFTETGVGVRRDCFFVHDRLSRDWGYLFTGMICES